MAVQPEGTPCWADAMFVDVEGAKGFYGDGLGWTFGESASEFGDYTQAFADGRAAAAVVPPMPGADDGPPAADPRTFLRTPSQARPPPTPVHSSEPSRRCDGSSSREWQTPA